MTIDQMNDLEGIRQLKARYFRLMDTQQWDAWADCFTADASASYEGAPRANSELPDVVGLEGRAQLVKGVRTLLTGAKSVHQGFMPELELTSATTARGIWAMFDHVMLPTCDFKGWGHYHEEYVKEGVVWRIKRIHLTRLHTSEAFL
ncbi:MAG TPA: nuclear transport factor 2 family protein [Candidatus Binataceae bacterium]|nr:nuclear transport factor 2 family protein [Candidatus Binataceae bacterium]